MSLQSHVIFSPFKVSRKKTWQGLNSAFLVSASTNKSAQKSLNHFNWNCPHVLESYTDKDIRDHIIQSYIGGQKWGSKCTVYLVTIKKFQSQDSSLHIPNSISS